MESGVVHIVGLDITVGTQLRQRCGWCGAVILDQDLALVAVQLQPCPDCGGRGDLPNRVAVGPTATERSHIEDLGTIPCARCDGKGEYAPPFGTWGVGALVCVDGGMTYVVEHVDGMELPDNCCGRLPHDVTGAKPGG